MSAPRLAPVSTAPTSRAPVRSAVMRAPERLAPSSVARCICAAKMLARVRLARLRSGLHEPSLIEDRPVEFCIAKLGLVEPRATQNGTRKIEAGEIEARELLAREIGRLKGCCGSDGSLDVCPRHFRRCHLRRRQIDVLHHTLGGCRNGGREAEHSDRTDADRRAYHRLALPRRLPFLNGRCSDDKRAELIIAQGLCARPPRRSRSRDRCQDEGSALEPLD